MLAPWRGSVGVGRWALGLGTGPSDPSDPSAPPTPDAQRPTPHDDVLDLLSALVDRSLVLAEEAAEGLRYRMLETVREYAREKLRERGEEEAARERHLTYYLHLAEEAGPLLSGLAPEPALALIEGGIGNFRAALAA